MEQLQDYSNLTCTHCLYLYQGLRGQMASRKKDVFAVTLSISRRTGFLASILLLIHSSKAKAVSFFQDFSNKSLANKHLKTTSYLNWDMWSVMQEFSATRDYQHLGSRLQSHTQIQRQPFPYKFILSPAFVVSYLRQFAAIPGQSLCDYWLSFQELQETKIKLTIPY